MSIGKIVGAVSKTVSKGAGVTLENMSNMKMVKKSLATAKEDPAKFIAGMALFSYVSKDAVNCVVYTSQSWNNKKLENPHFMAFLDLIQGILNVSSQLLVGKTILEKKLTPALQSKYTGTVKSSDVVVSVEKSKAKAFKLGFTNAGDQMNGVCKQLSSNPEIDNINDIKFDIKPLNKNRIATNLAKVTKELESKLGFKYSEKALADLSQKAQKHIESSCKAPFVNGLGLIVTILGTTALLKRTIVPFISTPIAGAMDDWLKAKEAKERDVKLA